jgi:4-oxalocrotonate tautomerase
MPYINLKLIGKLTKKQKARIASQFSETLEKVANKPKEYTYMVIEEVDAENWACGGKLFG